MKKISTDEWVSRAKQVHGDRYDYQSSVYVNASTRISVLCPKHGEWLCHPATHINAAVGCPVCSGRVTDTTQFISRAKELHGDRYDYSKSVYKKSIQKLVIICKKHGEFLQSPNNHLRNHGCPKCALEESSVNLATGKENFIKQSRQVHGDKYDYSAVVYNNARQNVKIICPLHGEFKQLPTNHLRYGCKKCAAEESSRHQRMNFPEFRNNADAIHGGRYQYVESTFSHLQEKLTIVCPEHGEFLQRGASHLRGVGCPKCAVAAASARYMKSPEDFVRDANEVHGDSYTYEDVVYSGASNKVSVTCKTHGQFSIKASHLLAGVGCPSCAEYGFNPNKPAILYYLKVRNGEGYKIGITNRTVAQRFSTEDMKHIQVLREVYYSVGEDALKEEQKILSEFSSQLIPDCSLLSSGNTEIFSWDVLFLDSHICDN